MLSITTNARSPPTPRNFSNCSGIGAISNIGGHRTGSRLGNRVSVVPIVPGVPTVQTVPAPAAARFLFVVEVVNHLRLDGGVDIFCHGVANLFADVGHRSQGSPDERERLGDLPGKSQIERDRADGASDVSGQRAAILSFRGVANPLEEIAIASVHTRLPCDLEQTHRPRVTFRMRPVADTRYPFFLFGVLFHYCLRCGIEVIW